MNPFQYYRHLRHTKRYVEDHLTETIGLADVAREVGLSPSHYSTFFHKATGVRFSDWLGKQRVELAKKILLESDRPIYRISEDVGFGSVSAFEGTFRKFEHISPRTYRVRGTCIDPQDSPDN